MRVFLQSILAQLLLTPYIYWRGRQALPDKKSWRLFYTLLFVAEITLYLIGFFLHKELPDEVMITIMSVCNSWYIASIYITLILICLEFLQLSNRRFNWYPNWIKRHWQQTKLSLFLLTGMAILLLMTTAYRTVMNPQVTHVYISLPKEAGDHRDSLTIAMMSDLHIGEVIGKEMVQKYVALSNAQQPDLVVLVGDIMDYESRFAEKAQIEEELKQLQAPMGMYMVYGNHEYRANRHAKYRWLQKTGGTLLIDSVAMPDSSFYLIGRDDFINKKRLPLQRLMQGLDKSKPVIVLDHQPWSLAEMVMNGVDIGLHGHTHNGQIWPYSLLLKLVFETPYGLAQKGPMHYYVSSGIGVAGMPYRVGTLSELVVLHVRFGKTEM